MGKRLIVSSHMSPERLLYEGNTEQELSPYPIWIYRSNSVSQPPEIKINLIRGHHSINHSFSLLSGHS